MMSSLLLVASGALLASASPVDLDKRRVTHTVTQYVYSTEVTTAVVTLAPGQDEPARDREMVSGDDNDDDFPGNDRLRYTPTEVFVQPTQEPEPKHWPSYQPKPTQQPSKPPPSHPSPGHGSDGNLDEYAKAMLDKHNEACREHGVQELKWDKDLAAMAQQSAENCIDDHDSHGKTVNGNGFGQNLAWLWNSNGGQDSKTSVALGGVKSWYEEKANYQSLPNSIDPVSSGSFSKIGHYTQIVWKATSAVGCGTYRCSGKVEWVTVCDYQSAGNVVGQFAKNVLPPSGS